MKRLALSICLIALPLGASALGVPGLHATRQVVMAHTGQMILAGNSESTDLHGKNGRSAGGGLFTLLKWVLSGEGDEDDGPGLAANPGAAGKGPPPQNGLIKKGAKPVVVVK